MLFKIGQSKLLPTPLLVSESSGEMKEEKEKNSWNRHLLVSVLQLTMTPAAWVTGHCSGPNQTLGTSCTLNSMSNTINL